MRYGISLPQLGEYGDVQTLVHLARETETAGWDGFFIWDSMLLEPTGLPVVDPWVALTAVALNTSRLLLGPMVTPLSRRRPWKLARETVSLDHVSQGRLVLGVGLGDPVQWDFGVFGEETDNKRRARLLDEGLDVLAGLWSGDPFSYDGEQYHIEEVQFLPRPVQTPRIPIWVGAGWANKAPLRRAARWDGVFPLKGGPGEPGLTPDDWQGILSYVNEHRTHDGPFDVVHGGNTPGDDPEQGASIVAPFAKVGVTWWLESIAPWSFGWQDEGPWPSEAMHQRILQGPPKV